MEIVFSFYNGFGRAKIMIFLVASAFLVNYCSLKPHDVTEKRSLLHVLESRATFSMVVREEKSPQPPSMLVKSGDIGLAFCAWCKR